MFESTANRYGKFLVRWTFWVQRGAWAVCAAAVLLSIFSAVYLVENIRINTSTSDMLSADLPFRQQSMAMDAAFPEMSDDLLVVIDGQTPDIADRSALALAARMRENVKVFGGVYDLAGEDYFRRNGLLYLDLDALYDLSDRLAEAQPFLGALWQDMSLRGLFAMLGKAIDAAQNGDLGQPLPIARVLNAISDVAEAQVKGAFSELSWRDLMQGRDDGANANRRFLLIQPALDYESLSPAADAMDAVRQLTSEMALTPDSGVRVRLTGSAALSEEELDSVKKGMGLAGILSFSLVMVLLVVGLKRLVLVVATILTLAMGLIWTAAFAVAALGALNLISVAFAVLFIGLSVDFGIHYALRYRESIDRGDGHGTALAGAAEGVGGALTLSAVAAAIAFYSFLPTDYRGLAELGLIAGTGMFIALFANLTVLPAVLSCLPKQSSRVPLNKTNPQAPGFAGFVRKRARSLCMAFGVAGGVAALIAPGVDFDFDPLNLKDRNTESMSTLIDLMADSRTSPYSIAILAPNLEAAQQTAARLSQRPEVASVETLADYVPADQDEKLNVIASTALFLSPALGGSGKRAVLTEEARIASQKTFAGKLEKLANSGDDANRRAATRLGAVLSKIAGRGGDSVRDMENRLLAALPAQLAILKQSLNAAPVSLGDLPKSLRSRLVAKDGRARIEVFPSENLQDRAALTRFVDTVRDISPNAIGSPVVILEAGRAVLRSFYQAGGLSAAVIAVLLVIVLGRLRDVLLVFAPLLLAGVFSLALSVVLGLSFNFANVIVLPLLFGLGVAGGIHLVSREAKEGGQGRVMETSTPRAVVFSALTTIGSFGSIALSSHPGTSSMGVLLTLTISMTLLCTLVFLPALMSIIARTPIDE